MISLDRLGIFLPAVQEFADVIDYRVGRMTSPSDDDLAAVKFAREFHASLVEIADKRMDLYCSFS